MSRQGQHKQGSPSHHINQQHRGFQGPRFVIGSLESLGIGKPCCFTGPIGVDLPVIGLKEVSLHQTHPYQTILYLVVGCQPL
jgi:hypothetical protein